MSKDSDAKPAESGTDATAFEKDSAETSSETQLDQTSQSTTESAAEAKIEETAPKKRNPVFAFLGRIFKKREKKVKVEKPPREPNAVERFFAKIGAALNKVFTPVGKFFAAAWEIIKKIDHFLSPKWLTLPDGVLFFLVMFLVSAFTMSVETIQNHILQTITDYTRSTSIISIAMLGLAIGGFIGYALNRFNPYATMMVSAAGLFVSMILSYFNIITIASLYYPYFMILPYIFASIIISVIFAKGNSHIIYFTNLVASGIGVILPIFLIPAFKSEGSMYLLMGVPIAIAFFLSLRIKNVIPKIAIAVLAVWFGVQFADSFKANIAYPEKISKEVFENKIVGEMTPAMMKAYAQNYVIELFNRDYKYDAGKDAYVLKADTDDYDKTRIKYFLGVLGFVNRFSIPFLDILEEKPYLADFTTIPKQKYEEEVLVEAKRRYTYTSLGSADLEVLRKAYTLEGNDYVLTKEKYDRERARLILAELGHFPFYDINFDLRRNGYFTDKYKIYEGNPRFMLSEDSTLGRVDYTLAADGSVNYSQNGTNLDNIDDMNGAYYDPRIPPMDKPKIFIVGLSADGIVKSARQKPGAQVSGVELNPTVWRTMTDGGFYQKAANSPYTDVVANEAEARSYLENSKEKYDIITLMNIHQDHGPVATLGPENFHSVEATKMMLSKLTDKGVLDYEEILVGRRSVLAFMKMMNTLKESLREMGVEKPEACIAIWKFDFWGGDVFRTVLVKRTPFTQEEMNRYYNYVVAFNATGHYTGVGWVFDPLRPNGTTFDAFVRGPDQLSLRELPTLVRDKEFIQRVLSKASDPRDTDFILKYYSFRSDGYYTLNSPARGSAEERKLMDLLDKAGYPVDVDLSPVTDDKPFPFDVYVKKVEVLDILTIVSLLSLFLVVPLIIILLQGTGVKKVSYFPPVVFAAASGFAYMLVEIVLIQKFMLFIGDPTYTFIVILGGMLLFSGLGSFVANFLPRWITGILSLAIPVLLYLYGQHLDGWFVNLASQTFTQKLWSAAEIIFPLTFLMGMPFPSAMDIMRKRGVPQAAPLLFGVNGVFSTLGSVIAMLLNLTYGYMFSFNVGTIAYAGALVFFFYLVLRYLIERRRAAKA